MKTTNAFYLVILLVLFSCNPDVKRIFETNKPASSDTALSTLDTLVKANDDYSPTSSGKLFDTTGIFLAPIKVLRSRFVEKEYSNYKDISLTYKNVSSKNITAIRFHWVGTNAFSELADMGGGVRGYGGGFDDDKLKAGRSVTNEWSILSADGKKIVLAWPYEVVFEDGTKWAIK